jgi:hypothetical protein
VPVFVNENVSINAVTKDIVIMIVLFMILPLLLLGLGFWVRFEAEQMNS